LFFNGLYWSSRLARSVLKRERAAAPAVSAFTGPSPYPAKTRIATVMTDRDDALYRRHRRGDWDDTFRRVRAYLSSRPNECWLFFVAGLLIGAVIL